MEQAERGAPTAIALEFPTRDAGSPGDSPPPKLPRRLMQRLAEGRSPPLSLEEIEAKLREADLRRQKFHEWLSSKARPRVRSPSSWSSQEIDLGSRLEAKLCAAEQNRLSLLQRAKMRLARLDELRQAAKIGAVLRFERERRELGKKMKSRIQQAETNRLLLLQAHLQRRAAAQERKNQSLMKRIYRENKYRECVQRAILQKRSAAERKRLGFLEAEKTRAQARVMRAQRVAMSVYHQREAERRKMREKLEARLLRAKIQRTEYLKQRGNPHCSRNAEILSRKLARCWKQFVRTKKTTCALAKSFESLGISEELVKLMPFEHLAARIGSPSSLEVTKTLLGRFENRLFLSLSSNSSTPENIDHLLKRVVSPRKKSSLTKTTRTKAQSKKEPTRTSRYPVRVVLCAYMILGHPDAVFSGRGEREIELADKALSFVREFEILVRVSMNGIQTSLDAEKRVSFRSQLVSFDLAWRSYLYSFVVWKVKDAKLLEEDLVRAACQLELSMMHKFKLSNEGEEPDLNHDMRAIQNQVNEDQQLLRERVKHLSGISGIERMESAISETRSKYFEQKGNGGTITPSVSRASSPSKSPVNGSTDSSTIFLNSNEKQYRVDHTTKSTRVVRSLFKDDCSSTPKPSAPTPKLAEENEVLVNEMLHQVHLSSMVDPKVNFNGDGRIKFGCQEKIKETMERAFWDGVAESLVKGKADYETLISLVKEVREELFAMSPKSWKDEIHGRIDLEILSQVLHSGGRDDIYLQEIMEYALGLLVKLAAPAKEDEMRKTHLNFFSELASHESGPSATAVVKGLRFVLEQIRALKEEISRARIQMMEPIIRGPAGVEYLQKAFGKRFGPPSDAATALPLTAQWISSCAQDCHQEWQQHVALLSSQSTLEAQGLPPATSLRSGGRTPGLTVGSPPPSQALSNSGGRDVIAECKGEKIDVLVRLGLLKLAREVEGLTKETVPETFQLNWLRLRNAQSLLQNTLVICTSLLVLRQTLISHSSTPSTAELETAVSIAAGKLTGLVDQSPNLGLVEIVAALTAPPLPENLQQSGHVMARLLSKSLQANDPVFVKVSGAVHAAARELVLGGGAAHDRAASALRRVGGSAMLSRLLTAAESVATVASVSVKVHCPWYAPLVNGTG
ncbi:T-complex protein 11 isoform X2 [Wolffia australiana]